MKDKRLDKIKKHYCIKINDQHFKILNHKIDLDQGVFIIRTKIMGQCLPTDNNIQTLIESETAQLLTISFKCMYKNEKIETWEYFVLS